MSEQKEQKAVSQSSFAYVSIGMLLTIGGLIFAAGSAHTNHDVRIRTIEERQKEDRELNRDDHKAIMQELKEMKKLIKISYESRK
jgi:hypothetical protein